MTKGFTLLELLIVIAIIGLLAGVVLVSFPAATERAKIANALQFSDTLRASLQADMVGWWPLDEISGGKTPDNWVDRNDGTIHGGVTEVEGVVNGALSFNGTGYISHSTGDISSTNGTIEGWVKPNVAYPWGFWQTHDSSGQNWPDWISMFMWYSGTFYFRMGNGSSCCNNDVTFSHTNIPAGKWSHLAFAWGGTTMKAYVNGEVVKSRTNAVFQSVVNPGARIGWGHNIKMNGLIDEVRIYNQPLTQAQIQEHYVEGLNRHQDLAKK